MTDKVVPLRSEAELIRRIAADTARYFLHCSKLAAGLNPPTNLLVLEIIACGVGNMEQKLIALAASREVE